MTSLRYLFLVVTMCGVLASASGQSQPPQLYPIPVNGKFGYIDGNGHVRIPPNFDWASAFRDGFAVIEVDEKYGFIDSNGTVVVKPSFDDAFPFSEGLAGACVGERCGFIDRSGKFVISPQYARRMITRHGVRAFSEGLAAVFMNGKWGYIDKTGKLVIPPQYDFAESFSDGLAAVGIAGHPATFGFIDHQGRVAIPFRYHMTRSFHEGFAIVIEPDLIGRWHGTSVIDRTGRRIYGPVPDAINEYHEGLASSYGLNQGKLFFIDTEGKHVLETKFTGENTIFSEGLAGVLPSDDGRLGYINKKGDLVIEGKFRMTCPFTQGLAFVETPEWAGYINTTGQFVWKTPRTSLGDAATESCPNY